MEYIGYATDYRFLKVIRDGTLQGVTFQSSNLLKKKRLVKMNTVILTTGST
jgi:hypothetical protein